MINGIDRMMIDKTYNISIPVIPGTKKSHVGL